MHTMMELTEHLTDELAGARRFAQRAYKYKNEDGPLSSTYERLANNELEQAEEILDAMKERAEETDLSGSSLENYDLYNMKICVEYWQDCFRACREEVKEKLRDL